MKALPDKSQLVSNTSGCQPLRNGQALSSGIRQLSLRDPSRGGPLTFTITDASLIRLLAVRCNLPFAGVEAQTRRSTAASMAEAAQAVAAQSQEPEHDRSHHGANDP